MKSCSEHRDPTYSPERQSLQEGHVYPDEPCTSLIHSFKHIKEQRIEATPCRISTADTMEPPVGLTGWNPVSTYKLDKQANTALIGTGNDQVFTQSAFLFDDPRIEQEARMRLLAEVFIDMFKASRSEMSAEAGHKVAL